MLLVVYCIISQPCFERYQIFVGYSDAIGLKMKSDLGIKFVTSKQKTLYFSGGILLDKNVEYYANWWQ